MTELITTILLLGLVFHLLAGGNPAVKTKRDGSRLSLISIPQTASETEYGLDESLEEPDEEETAEAEEQVFALSEKQEEGHADG